MLFRSGSCLQEDECGVCGGDGIPAGDCDCDGNQLDALGVCGGDCAADADADGICDDVDDCIGTYDALGDCNGTCPEDANANGICDADENFDDPSMYCGPGTTWDASAGQCVGATTCQGDFDGDGTIATADLLGFLAVFGSVCE